MPTETLGLRFEVKGVGGSLFTWSVGLVPERGVWRWGFVGNSVNFVVGSGVDSAFRWGFWWGIGEGIGRGFEGGPWFDGWSERSSEPADICSGGKPVI